MEIEWQPIQSQPTTPAAAIFDKPVNTKRILLLLLNVVLLMVGGSGSPIFVRIYFLHGGNRKWFASFLQTAAFPFLLLPLLFSFSRRRRRSRSRSSSASPTPLFLISPFLLVSSAVIGILTGLVNFLYSYGSSYLPVSTSSLLISTQLGFTALLAFLIVRQKFTASSINSVVLLTFSAVVLGVHANGDRPEGESTAKYLAGFAMMLGAAVLYGLVLPLMELMYNKAKQDISYTLVIEIQIVMAAAATAFCAVGMVVNNDFQEKTGLLIKHSLSHFISSYVKGYEVYGASIAALSGFVEPKKLKRPWDGDDAADLPPSKKKKLKKKSLASKDNPPLDAEDIVTPSDNYEIHAQTQQLLDDLRLSDIPELLAQESSLALHRLLLLLRTSS
ncbi:Purine permease 1 [Platanthera zijinensis]|uniref:Probable purine permease n=1 Tax=Platanthera zijinensis TaxID=2320716 RepID=A0AAP0C2F6_9ASPA